jgi:hypothetical protein
LGSHELSIVGDKATRSSNGSLATGSPVDPVLPFPFEFPRVVRCAGALGRARRLEATFEAPTDVPGMVEPCVLLNEAAV